MVFQIQRLSNLLPFSFMHRTLCETKIDNFLIPEDTLVIPFLGAILNDPEYFPDPEKFDPGRFLTEEHLVKKVEAWIPFSAGENPLFS